MNEKNREREKEREKEQILEGTWHEGNGEGGEKSLRSTEENVGCENCDRRDKERERERHG